MNMDIKQVTFVDFCKILKEIDAKLTENNASSEWVEVTMIYPEMIEPDLDDDDDDEDYPYNPYVTGMRLVHKKFCSRFKLNFDDCETYYRKCIKDLKEQKMVNLSEYCIRKIFNDIPSDLNFVKYCFKEKEYHILDLCVFIEPIKNDKSC